MFVTLEDRGVYDVVPFPQGVQPLWRPGLRDATMRVTGRIEADGRIDGEKLEASRK